MRARSMQMMNNVVIASQERHGMQSLTKEAFMLRLGWNNRKMGEMPRKSDDRSVPMRRQNICRAFEMLLTNKTKRRDGQIMQNQSSNTLTESYRWQTQVTKANLSIGILHRRMDKHRVVLLSLQTSSLPSALEKSRTTLRCCVQQADQKPIAWKAKARSGTKKTLARKYSNCKVKWWFCIADRCTSELPPTKEQVDPLK